MRAYVLAAAAIALAGPGVAAASDPTFEVTASPERVTAPVPIFYRITVTTGSDAERFDLLVRQDPHFDGWGSLLQLDCEAIWLDGPGTRDPMACPGIAAPTPCSPYGFRERHGDGYNFSPRAGFAIPANTSTTIVVHADPHRDAPWSGVAYSASLATSNGSNGTLSSPGPLAVPAVANDGRRGVRMSVTTSIASVPAVRQPPPSPSMPAACATPPTTSARPVTISGTTDLPAGQPVKILAGLPGATAPVQLGEATTASDGGFRFDGWNPQVPGRYVVTAIYTTQRSDLADDFAIPVTFELTEAAQAGPPTPTHVEPAPARARLVRIGRFGRNGRGRIRLACSSGQDRCAGTLRLVRREVRLLTRAARFDIAPGATATASLRLTRSARVRLARARRLAVVARIRDSGGVRLIRVTLRR